jgi:hypothetical protein
MAEIKSVSLAKVPQEWLKLAESHKISFSRATETGLGLLLADAGLIEYPQTCLIVRRYLQAKGVIAEMQRKVEKIRGVSDVVIT